MSYESSKPFKHAIKSMIKDTWKNNAFITIQDDLLYPTFQTSHRGKEIDHTDGIGTKGHLHWLNGTFHEAVLDVIAMNVNDLAMVGCVPYKAQIHITLPRYNQDALLTIMQHMVNECIKRKIAITGGETAINNLSAFDISMTVSGVVSHAKTRNLQEGDVLVALLSNGAHSNGFTLLRKCFDYGDSRLLLPTADYSKVDIMNNPYACMHITGGAFTKLKDILPTNCDAHLHIPSKIKHIDFWQDVAKHVTLENVAEFFTTLNWGIGMVIAIPATRSIPKDSIVIGHVAKGSGKVMVKPPQFMNYEKVQV